jgi:hypothetical protein
MKTPPSGGVFVCGWRLLRETARALRVLRALAQGKLAAMVQAARKLRREYGGD